MASIDWSNVVAFTGDDTLDDVSSYARTVILEHVNTRLNVAAFGGEDAPKLRIARLLLAAHLGTLTTPEDDESGSGGSTAGPVTSETYAADSVSISYGASATSGAARFVPRALESMSETRWGQEYERLVRTLAAARLPFLIE